MKIDVKEMVDKTCAFLKSRQYKEAFETLHLLADAANPKGLYYLGLMYCAGFGVKEDFPKGWDLIQKAAQQGQWDSNLFLGRIDFDGKDIPKNSQDYFKRIEEKERRIEEEAMRRKGKSKKVVDIWKQLGFAFTDTDSEDYREIADLIYGGRREEEDDEEEED